jgi:large subunit ribosomal protein L22
MIAKATLRYVRISPRKVRPVIPLVKGKRAQDAIAVLYSVKKRASQYLIDLIESAMANAKRLPGIDAANLFVSNIIANGGPQMKRFRAASMGRASTIRKRTSHITVELDEITRKETPAKEAVSTDAKKAKDVRGKEKDAHAEKARKGVAAKEPVKHESKKGAPR